MTFSVVVDITALREDDDASVEWIEGGFSSTTSWIAKKSTNIEASSLDLDDNAPRQLSWALLNEHRRNISNSHNISNDNSHIISHEVRDDFSRSSVASAELDGEVHGSLHNLDRSRAREKFAVIRHRNPSRDRRASERSSSRDKRRLGRSHGASQSKSATGSTTTVDVRSSCDGAMCAHKFNMFKVPRSFTCSSCGLAQKIGVHAFGCETCVYDICESCHTKANEKQVQPDDISVSSTRVSSFSSDSLSSFQSESTVASWAIVEYACEKRSSLKVRSQGRTGSMSFNSSASVRKECGLCKEPYTGFGGVCSTCRKFGLAGNARQCQGCHQFFQGFGSHCPDCIPEDPCSDCVRT